MKYFNMIIGLATLAVSSFGAFITYEAAEDQKLKEISNAYVNLEEFYQTQRITSLNISEGLANLGEWYDIVQESTTEKIYELKTNDDQTSYATDIFYRVNLYSDQVIKIREDEKVFLSKEARKAIGSLNGTRKYLKSWAQGNEQNLGYWRAFRVHGKGLLQNYYFGFYKKELDIIGHDIERLERMSKRLKLPVENRSNWSKGIELVPSERHINLISHRYPRMKAYLLNDFNIPKGEGGLSLLTMVDRFGRHNKLLDTTKMNPEIKFVLIDADADDSDINEMKANMIGIYKTLKLMGVKQLSNSQPYYEVYEDNRNKKHGYWNNLIRPL